MLLETKFTVHVKVDNDEEFIPCVDWETASYCVRNLKRYGYKVSDIEIIDNEKEVKLCR